MADLKEIGTRYFDLCEQLDALDETIRPRMAAILATIEPQRSQLKTQIDEIEGEHGEFSRCEHCDTPTRTEDLVGRDVMVCPTCQAAWLAEVAACAHEFRDGACIKCTVRDPDAPDEDC